MEAGEEGPGTAGLLAAAVGRAQKPRVVSGLERQKFASKEC